MEGEKERNNFCSFCYKKVHHVTSPASQQMLFHQFFKSVQTYLACKLIEEDTIEVLESCLNCCTIISSFCTLFHELKCLEMKVEWRLQKLQQVLQNEELGPFKGNCDDEMVFKKVSSFRKNFQQSCTKHFSKSLPRVSLVPACVVSGGEAAESVNIACHTENPSSLEKINDDKDDGLEVKTETLEGERSPLSSNNYRVDSFETCSIIQSCISDTVHEINFICVACTSIFKSQIKLETHSKSCNPSLNSICSVKVNKEKVSTKEQVTQPISQVVTKLCATTTTSQCVQEKGISIASELNVDNAFATDIRKIKKPTGKLSSSSGKKKKKEHERIIKRRRTQQKPVLQYKCICCNQQFSSYERLTAHRRNGRHAWMRKKYIELKSQAKNLVFLSKKRNKKPEKKQSSMRELRPRNSKLRTKMPVDDDSNCSDNHSGDDLYQNPSDSDSSSSSTSFADSSLEEDEREESPSKTKKQRRNSSVAQPALPQQQNNFECKVIGCAMSFNTEEDLQTHSKLHGSFPCSFCNAIESYAPALALHESKLHAIIPKTETEELTSQKKSPLYRCARCSFSSTWKSKLVSHHLSTHLSLTWATSKCSICSIKFLEINMTSVNQTIRRHMRTHHDFPKGMINPSKIIRCAKCPAYFKKGNQLFIHRKKIHGEDPLKCPTCEKSFRDSYKVKRHKCGEETTRQEKKRKPPFKRAKEAMKRGRLEFICESCGMSFKYKKTLLEHTVKVHAAPAPRKFSCSYCSVEFLSWPALVQHNESLKHKMLEAKHMQNSGNKAFPPPPLPPLPSSTAQEKVLETQANPTEPLNSSDSSSSSSESGSDFDSDDIDDKTVKNKVCSYCGKLFTLQWALERHEKTCKNESHPPRRGPYLKRTAKCKIGSCSEKFHTKDELKLHKKLHGSFPCNFCDVVESYAIDLALHETTHAQKLAEDTYNCARCPYSCNHKFFFVDHHLEKHLNLSRKTAQCHICKEFYKNALKLERHIKINHKDDENETKSTTTSSSSQLKCDKCSAFFSSKGKLSKHKKKMHPSPPVQEEGGPLKCRYCEESFPSKKYLHAHFRAEHNTPFVCKVDSCSSRFTTQEDLERHEKLHGSFNCSVCEVIEDYAPNLAFHELTHSSSSSSSAAADEFNCPRCIFRTTHKGVYLSHHLETHLGLKWAIRTCPICSKQFYAVSPADARSHQRFHLQSHHGVEGMSPDSIPKCDQCPAYFRKYQQLVRHKESIHKVKHPLICVDCGNKSSKSSLLRKHRMRKHGKREADFKLVCQVPQCGETFEEEFQLNWHGRNIHDDDKNAEKAAIITVICEECGQVCSSEKGLKSHMIKHKNERTGKKLLANEKGRFVCEECGKGMKSQGFLDLHRLSHSGPQSWEHECLVCEKRCLTEDKLLEHLRVHTRERPYNCLECGEEYAHGHNLRNHRKKAHGIIDVPRRRRKLR